MTDTQLPTKITPAERLLTAEEFYRLKDVPPETEWFRNISNPSTKRAYQTRSAISCGSRALPGRRNSAP
jgi:hypothetical protein